MFNRLVSDTIPCDEGVLTLEAFTKLNPQEHSIEFQRDLNVLEANMVESDTIDALTQSNEDLITKHKRVTRLFRFI